MEDAKAQVYVVISYVIMSVRKKSESVIHQWCTSIENKTF